MNAAAQARKHPPGATGRAIEDAASDPAAIPPAGAHHADTPALPPSADCPECGGGFWRVPHDKKYCCEPCKRAHHRRREARGVEAIDDLMDWRETRLPGLFTKLTRKVDNWRAEDRARKKHIKQKRKD